MPDSEKSSERGSIAKYALGAAGGIALYILASGQLAGIHGGATAEKDIMSAVSQMMESEHAANAGAQAALDAKINNLSAQVSSFARNYSMQSELQPATFPPQGYIPEVAMPYGGQQGGYPPGSYPGETLLPSNSYPTHDFYFAWESSDKGIAHARRAYRISINTGKILENLKSVGTWFRDLFKKQ
jgi:hypothetical protein